MSVTGTVGGTVGGQTPGRAMNWVHPTPWRRMRYVTSFGFCKWLAHKTLHRDTRTFVAQGAEVGTRREKGVEK